MTQTKLRVGAPANQDTGERQMLIPISVPDIDDIRSLAEKLHAVGAQFEGEVWSWPVNYEPELPEPPLDSNLTFTPASFWIGVWPFWYVSLTWEHGHDEDPSILIEQNNLLPQPMMLHTA